MAQMRSDDQLGMDEELIENPDVEAALVARQELANARRSLNKDFKKAHQKAIALLELIELPEDGAVRIGRFRVTNRFVVAAHREFDTSDRSQISIAFLGDDGAAAPKRRARPARADDDADLRPTGEVNADALRGAAERSAEPTPFRPRQTH
jgi:hypothetical protein